MLARGEIHGGGSPLAQCELKRPPKWLSSKRCPSFVALDVAPFSGL
jgi:hypothetical protein